MSNINSTILAEIDWDEGLSMPAANAENKQLENEVQKKQTLLVAIKSDLADNEERSQVIAEHLKNMRQELLYKQGLVNAKENDLQTESHLLKISQREKGRLRQEITRLMKEMDDLKEKKNTSEKNIFRQTRKIEELKSAMNWDQKTLDVWLEESARKDEDAMIILKYTRQDEVKIRDLSLLMEKLMAEALVKKHQLDLEMISTLTAQIELDKTAENFRRVHSEREELLAQWESTLDLMQKRDRDMEMLADKMAESKKEVRRRDNIMQRKLKFLNQERENNREQEKKINKAERTSIHLKLELSEVEKQKSQFENDTDTLKRTVEKIITDLELARTGVALLKKEIVEKSIKLHQVKMVRENLVEKLKAAVTSTLSAGEVATNMDDLLMAEERRVNELTIEIKHLEDLLCKKETELKEAKAEERMTEASINSAHNTIKNLNSKIQRLDADTLKQQEILYSQELILQQLEKRCIRMQGDHNMEEKGALETQVCGLQDQLDNENRAHMFLVIQYRRVQEKLLHLLIQEHLRQVVRSTEQSKAERAEFVRKFDDCSLYCDGCVTQLKGLIKKKQNVMVEHNLLKLEIKKYRDLLYSQSDDVLSLEKRKLSLESARKEREQEIKICKEILTAQIKAGEEEMQKASAELHQKMSNITKLKKRYEILMIPLTPPGEEEEKSQVYYVIKAVHDREVLQKEGDDLDKNIRKAEKEIVALENTLKLIHGRNILYQKSFEEITQSGHEMKEKHDLDEQMKAVMDKYKYKRGQIRALEEDIQKANQNLDTKMKAIEDLRAVIESKKNTIIRLCREAEAQLEKLNRAVKLTARLSRILRITQKSEKELPEEKDIELRELREFNKNIIKMIEEAAVLFPAMSEAVQLHFSQASIPRLAASTGHCGVLGSKQGSASSVTSSQTTGNGSFSIESVSSAPAD